LNYQIVFGIGAVGAAMSTFHLGRIHPPPAAVAAATSNPQTGLSNHKPLIRADLLRSSFGPLLLAYFCFYASQHIPVPLNPLFRVQVLHLSDGEIGIGNTMFYATMTAASMLLPRLTARYGHRKVLIVGSMFYSAYPLLTGLAQDSTLFWAASLSGGVVWGLTNGGLLNRLMERVPANDRPAHMAWHNVVFNLGILGGSLLGAALSHWVGLRYGLLIAAILRFASGLAFLLWA